MQSASACVASVVTVDNEHDISSRLVLETLRCLYLVPQPKTRKPTSAKKPAAKKLASAKKAKKPAAAKNLKTAKPVGVKKVKKSPAPKKTPAPKKVAAPKNAAAPKKAKAKKAAAPKKAKAAPTPAVKASLPEFAVHVHHPPTNCTCVIALQARSPQDIHVLGRRVCPQAPGPHPLQLRRLSSITSASCVLRTHWCVLTPPRSHILRA